MVYRCRECGKWMPPNVLDYCSASCRTVAEKQTWRNVLRSNRRAARRTEKEKAQAARSTTEGTMLHFTCDRCGQSIVRRDLRSGKIEHLADGALCFELCFRCYCALRQFLYPAPDGKQADPACVPAGVESGANRA